MRPGQNTKRMRGRPNNRKGPNPLTRTYESSGPDVKIRGTAHHIGEKYLQLARDAQSSGDPVMAESYLQHAEHYFRLIATAQLAQQQSAIGYPRLAGEPLGDELDADDDFAAIPDRFASPPERFPSNEQPAFVPQPQPASIQPGFEKPFYGGPDRSGFERPERGPRPQRNFPDKSFADRGPPERPFADRGQGRDLEGRGGRGGGRDFRNEPQPRADTRSNVSEVESKGLPAFLAVPVRQPTAPVEGNGAAVETLPTALVAQPEVDRDANGYHLRPRRRRRGKSEMMLEQESGGEVTDARDPVGD